jgi:hypothetical protein
MINVMPRNRFVEFDVDAYLYENHLAEVPVEPQVEETVSMT